MTAPLPAALPRRYGTTTAARLRRESGEVTTLSIMDLLPGKLLSACRFRRADDGTVELQRRDYGGPSWHAPTPALLAQWARDLRLDADPDDEWAPPMLAAADVAERVCQQVVALAERALASPSRTATVLSPAAALARQLVRSRELVVDGDSLLWRLRVRDPIHGIVGRDPEMPTPGGDRAPLGLLGRLRPDALAGAEPVTAGVVEHVVRAGGFLAPTAERPAWPDVVRELRLLAGLPAEPDTASGTTWLRRRSGV